MINVFGDSIASGPRNLQVVKKAVVTSVGKFKDYIHEIQQRYVLGFTSYRLINSKLIYFAKGDGNSGVALQGDRGHSGARGLKGDSGDKGPVGSRGRTGKHGVEGPEDPPGKTGKIGPVGSTTR